MQLSPSGYTDTFCRDHLPPPDQWPTLRFDLPELKYPDRLNAGVELLDRTAQTHGADRPCLHAPGQSTWSYGEVIAAANRVAHVLTEDLGLQPGNRVLLRGPNNTWLAACWLGALKAGVVSVSTMPLLRAGELRTISEISGIAACICDHRFLADLEGAALGVPVLAYGGEADDDLTRRAERHPDTFEPVDTAADDVAMLAFTSGTTGRPKATMHFHRDLLAMADSFSARLLEPTPEDVFTGTPPLAFTFGLGQVLVFPLRAGSSTLLIERATPAELVDLIAEHGVTVCATAPTAYKAMLATGDVSRLRSLRTAVSAGEHLPAATWEAFKQATGVAIVDGIGSTEMLHIFIASAGGDIRPGSTGRAVPGYVAAVVDDDGEPVPPGTPGHLVVQGPTGCRYLADPRQQVYVHDGWNVTGDTYSCDEDGYFWYHARSDDMIVSSGYNIAAPEVEEAVLAHPDVSECAVVGVPDEARGMVVKAYVVLRDGVVGDDEKAEELKGFVKQQIAPYKYPRALEFLEALPRTNTGKLQRYRLRG
ncbi:MAG TPA: AMP-binding protein [Nocardioidaceae bacterium]|nr:AMP-binding protein [Nocardioidaceae bacterium]